MRIVLDTNVLVSSTIVEGGALSRLADYWVEERFELISSVYQLEELRRVINYPRLRKRIMAGKGDALLISMVLNATIVGTLPDVQLSKDPDDNKILATAIAGDADVMVSGDKAHVLNIGTFGQIKIVTPRDALHLLEGSA